MPVKRIIGRPTSRLTKGLCYPRGAVRCFIAIREKATEIRIEKGFFHSEQKKFQIG
jgi:hypothetical protein